MCQGGTGRRRDDSPKCAKYPLKLHSVYARLSVPCPLLFRPEGTVYTENNHTGGSANGVVGPRRTCRPTRAPVRPRVHSVTLYDDRVFGGPL